MLRPPFSPFRPSLFFTRYWDLLHVMTTLFPQVDRSSSSWVCNFYTNKIVWRPRAFCTKLMMKFLRARIPLWSSLVMMSSTYCGMGHLFVWWWWWFEKKKCWVMKKGLTFLMSMNVCRQGLINIPLQSLSLWSVENGRGALKRGRILWRSSFISHLGYLGMNWVHIGLREK